MHKCEINIYELISDLINCYHNQQMCLNISKVIDGGHRLFWFCKQWVLLPILMTSLHLTLP